MGSIIGRERPADIIVPAEQVSARHASIARLDETTFLIRDLDSLNGVFVNGVRVTSMVIRPSDEVRLGSYLLSWQLILNAIPPAPTRTPVQVPEREEVAGEPRSRKVNRDADSERSKLRSSSAVELDESKDDQQPRSRPEVRRETRRGHAPLSAEFGAALAAQKTYGGKAFLVWLLYWMCWLPGFIMNLVYLSEANSVKRQTGVSPSGRGCLIVLLVFYVILPLAAAIATVVLGGSILSSVMRSFESVLR